MYKHDFKPSSLIFITGYMIRRTPKNDFMD